MKTITQEHCNPGKSTAVRRSCVPPPFYRHLLITNYYTYTHIHTYIKIWIHLPTPDPSPPSLWTASLTSGSVTSAGNGCRTGWLLAGAGLLPLLQSRVSMVYYVLLLLRCFSCSHTVLPKEHSLGVIFFLLTFLMLCCIFLQFPVFLSCLPPCHMYVVYVWTGWWLISLVLVTSDNKGLLLLLLMLQCFISIPVS